MSDTARSTTNQPVFIEPAPGLSSYHKETAFMKRPAALENITGSQETGRQILDEHLLNEAFKHQATEENTMFDLDTVVSLHYADRSFTSEAELQFFLLSLSQEQLAQTEVVQDDATFVVFYPQMPATTAINPRRSGHHFDMDGPVRHPKYEAEDYVNTFLLMLV